MQVLGFVWRNNLKNKGNGVKVTNVLTMTALAAVVKSSAVMAAEPMTADQKTAVEQVVHDYLVHNPEILVEASQALQQKQQQTMQEQAKTAILEQANALFNEKLTVTGNPKGNVTLVEFFDYQCIHCKKRAPVIEGLQKKDSNLRVIYREFPIFGKSSEIASQAALAAAMQGKYQVLHDALLKLDKRLDEKLVMNTAKSVGLNMVQLKKDMASKTVKDALDANRQLAEKIHLMGTPAFIVASTTDGQLKANTQPAFIPGAASEETLQDLISKASS